MTENDTPKAAEAKAEAYTAPAEELRKGYAVFNTTLQQYVGQVTEDKPTATEARKLVPEGHDVEVRAV